MDYWEECISIAADECGLTLTKEQLDCLVEAVQCGLESYGMAHGHDCIPNSLILENDLLQREIKIEKDKVLCKECNGSGRIIENYSGFSTESECSKCRGEGRHSL